MKVDMGYDFQINVNTAISKLEIEHRSMIFQFTWNYNFGVIRFKSSLQILFIAKFILLWLFQGHDLIDCRSFLDQY